jgi:carbon-monoxide dehydrogenase medium subunit
VKPSAFEYYAPRSLEECLDLLSEHGEDAKLLAGGQSLVPLMNLRMAVPEVIVDLNRVRGLASIERRDGTLAIGAMTRYADVETSPLVADALPVLARVTAEVGYPAIRNRGTVGGALAHADPVGEWPCLARALDAELVVAGPRGGRTVTAGDFFTGIMSTALDVDEVLVEARFRVDEPPRAWGFREFARKTGDYAVMATIIDFAVDGGALRDVRAGYANLSDRPVRSEAVERWLEGRDASDPLDGDPGLVEALAEECSALGAAEERVHLAGVMTRRALADALARAREATT